MDIEELAARRCAQYQMERDTSREEIGSSDVSIEVEQMKRVGDWPTAEDRGEVPLGFLVDEYQNDLDILSDDDALMHSVSDTLARVKRDGSWQHALPEFLYEGKHMLSQESTKLWGQAKALFS